MEVTRRPFQGVLNILSFNRHFYLFGLGSLAVGLAVGIWFEISPMVMGVAIALSAYGLLVPLLVSAYVYDGSGYYRLDWLRHFEVADAPGNRLISIHAGFDETSFLIKRQFPLSELQVFDFYNPRHHTEQAIVRARHVSQVYPGTRSIPSNAIPLESQSVDVIFLLSAVHEIRSHHERVTFLSECHRVCKPGGTVILVEHLRDIPNFLAFSIGFTHFFSRATWIRALREAGFPSVRETKFTPFMSIFTTSP